MWGFLIKGVSQKSYQQNAYGTPFIETPCIFTFLHFPCTHASKERCRKHSGYLGCTLLRPFSFLRLHLVTLLCSWLILKLQERDKWVVGACGDIFVPASYLSLSVRHLNCSTVRSLAVCLCISCICICVYTDPARYFLCVSSIAQPLNQL